jgi:SAM-dependent methyltransferase
MAWNFERLTGLSTGYWASAALNAAVKLNLFAFLSSAGAEAHVIAQRAETSPEMTRLLLDALVGAGILIRQGPLYRLEPSAQPFLDPAAPDNLLDALRFNGDLYPLWGRLDNCVRDGQPAQTSHAHLGGDPDRTLRFVKGMHSRGRAVAPILVPALDFPTHGRLLDVASGPGVFSLDFAARNSELHVTLFDLPPILDTTRTLIPKTLNPTQVTFHPGDYHRDPLPAGQDAVLFCGALHQETHESVRHLFPAFNAALKPGGRLILADFLLTPDRSEPLFAALFAINMRLLRPTAHVFDEAELTDALVDAGFESIRFYQPEDCPYRILHARSGLKRSLALPAKDPHNAG